MEKFMRQDLAILSLRLAAGGVMFLSHGLPKLQKYTQLSAGFPDPLGIGNSASLILTLFAEVFCALCIFLGVKTKWASIPLLITMLVAIFIVHGADPWQKKELAAMYGFIYLALIGLGSGNYSVDKIFLKKS